jgi:hypothetical protein
MLVQRPTGGCYARLNHGPPAGAHGLRAAAHSLAGQVIPARRAGLARVGYENPDVFP